jgi:hypothetical protein
MIIEQKGLAPSQSSQSSKMQDDTTIHSTKRPDMEMLNRYVKG